MGLKEQFGEFLVGIPVNAVLRERILGFQERLQALDDEVAKLNKENGRLVSELTEARRKLAAQAETEQFTDHRGAKFKKLPRGGYEQTVYCPRCGYSAAPLTDFNMFRCAPCKWQSSFGIAELPGILAGLEK